MRLCFIVASTYDRVHLLNKCIDAFLNSKHAECDLYLYFQGENFNEIEKPEAFKAVMISPELRGIFTPRYELMKRYALEYDYTVIIDDDLYMRPETDYFKTAKFLGVTRNAGCAVLTNWAQSVRNEISLVSYPDYYNVMGGLVLPRRSVQIFLDYFSGKEADYTEDMIWLLLWVKGYDLYLDHRSMAVHQSNRKSKTGGFTGYSTVRMTKPYLPILSEWFYDCIDTDADDQARFPSKVFGIKSLANAKPEAFAEREKNRRKLNADET